MKKIIHDEACPRLCRDFGEFQRRGSEWICREHETHVCTCTAAAELEELILCYVIAHNAVHTDPDSHEREPCRPDCGFNKAFAPFREQEEKRKRMPNSSASGRSISTKEKT